MKKVAFAQENLSKVISLGGYYTQQNVESKLECFPVLPQGIRSHCSLKLRDCLYCIGGNTSRGLHLKPTNAVWQMKIKNQELNRNKVNSMKESRCKMAAALHPDGIVVAGGDNGTSTLDLVEIDEIHANRWRTLSPLIQPKRDHSLVSCQDSIYALGGWDRRSCFSSVERQDDLGGAGENIKPMLTPRFCFTTITCNGLVYAIGGKYGLLPSSITKSVKKYNVKAYVWSQVRLMNFERTGFPAYVSDEKIFVVGGRDLERDVVKEIECYDPSSNKWIIVAETDNKLYAHAIVVV